MQPTHLPSASRRAIDLFAGCGGLTLGLRRAGFEVVAAIDNDPLAASTYRKNHQSTRVFECDITKIKPRKLMKLLRIKRNELDLVAGCPPCQGFSTLRTLNGARDAKDSQNDLVFQFSRFVTVFRPKSIMMENVPGLMNDERLEWLRCELHRLNYRTSADVFDAAQYGVPQRRRRLLLVGGLYGVPPFAYPSRRRTVSQAIRYMPAPERSDDPAHNYEVKHAEKIKALICRIPKDGGSRADLPVADQLECHKRLEGFWDVYGRMEWNREAPTITGGCINPSKGRFLHPEKDRAITLREAALLQGFPMDYEFDLSRGRYSVAQLIGNAFPPKFAEHHAREIYRYLDKQNMGR